MHDLGAGMSAAAKKPLLAQAASTIIPTICCPSRRPPRLYPNSQTMYNSNTPPQAAHTDYASSAGTDQSIMPAIVEWAPRTGDPASVGGAGGTPYPNTSACSGVIFTTSQIRIIDIRDGTSSTYLIGEKYLDPDHYLDSGYEADNNPYTQGMDWDHAPLPTPLPYRIRQD